MKITYPGLAKEVKMLLKELNLPDITNPETNRDYNKLEWKKMVKKEIVKKCEKELREEMKPLSKLFESKMINEKFETKPYLKSMKVEEARTKFKFRTEMLNFKFNYKHDPVNLATLWNCDSCQSAIETQGHILWCPAYSDLRQDKDINNDKHLIEYIQKVLQIREKLNITK